MIFEFSGIPALVVFVMFISKDERLDKASKAVMLLTFFVQQRFDFGLVVLGDNIRLVEFFCFNFEIIGLGFVDLRCSRTCLLLDC